LSSINLQKPPLPCRARQKVVAVRGDETWSQAFEDRCISKENMCLKKYIVFSQKGTVNGKILHVPIS
jgi:hypothetical protein